MSGQVELTIREPEGEGLVAVMPRRVSTAVGRWIGDCPEPLTLWFRKGETCVESSIEFPAASLHTEATQQENRRE